MCGFGGGGGGSAGLCHYCFLWKAQRGFTVVETQRNAGKLILTRVSVHTHCTDRKRGIQPSMLLPDRARALGFTWRCDRY